MEQTMKKPSIILRLLLAISITAVLIITTAIVREVYIIWQGQSFYANMLAEIETHSRGQEYHNAENRQDAGEDVEPSQDDTSIAQWIPYVDFELLNESYPGIVAWIRLEDTQIDYPVMQYINNEYFLTRLPDGTSHRSGSIFLDYRNSSDFSDKSILIYGHMSSAREMFAPLENYRNQEFYDANPVIYLHTPQKDYMIVLFAGYLAHSQRDHPPLYFWDNETFLNYVESLKRISLFNSDVVVSADDIIVSLCTCAYDFDEARWVVTGILVEFS